MCAANTQMCADHVKHVKQHTHVIKRHNNTQTCSKHAKMRAINFKHITKYQNMTHTYSEFYELVEGRGF